MSDYGFPEDEFEAPSNGPSISVASILGMLRRRAKVIAFATVVAIPLAFVAPLFQQLSYVATSQVAIEEKPEIYDFGAEVVSSLQLPTRRPLDRVYAVAISNRVLGRVVDQLPAPAEDADPDGLTARARGFAADLGILAPRGEVTAEMLRQRRIRALRGSVRLGDAGGGTILTISVTAETPAQAAYLANSIADAYVDYVEDRRRTAASSTVTWLRMKAGEFRTQVRGREEAMSQLAKRVGPMVTAKPVFDGGASASSWGSATQELEEQLRTARLDLLTMEQRLQSLRRSVNAHEAMASAPDLAEQRERYKTLRHELETARLKYTATHPNVIRLEQLTDQLAEELGPHRSAVEDPISPEELREARALESQHANLVARVAALEGSLEKMYAASEDSADAVAEYQRLSREVAVDREMLSVLLERLNQTLISQATEHAEARILDYAPLPESPDSTPRRLILAGGLAAALVFGLGVGVAFEFLDGGIYDHERLEGLLGAPFLGAIPLLDQQEGRERHGIPRTSTFGGEAFRNLRARLAFAFRESKCKTLVVTSAVATEGKSTTTSNLATTFSIAGQSVLVIDADMRRPRIDRIYAIDRSPGLSDVLRGDADLQRAIVRPLGVDFDILPAGTLADDPAELLASPKVELHLARLAHQYDLVLVDAPVLLSISDALILASKVDGVLMVHKPGAVDFKAFTRASEALRFAGARLVGFVMNQVDPRDRHEYPSYLRSPYICDRSEPTGWQRLRSRLRV